MVIHSPEDVGMSGARLQAAGAYLDRAVADSRLPGIIALVQRRGKVIHHSLHGMMDIAAQRPMPADALFRIYSMTKPIVSVALMMLHDEGRFQLHDQVAKYIPAIGSMKVFSHLSDSVPQYVPQDPPMTIFHLLTHMAGLTYGGDAWHPVDLLYRKAADSQEIFRRDMSLEEMIARLAKLPLKFQPGSNWNYGVSTDVLGYLVEVIGGIPLADFLKERIFEPLAMVDTDFYVPPEKAARLATIYVSDALYDPAPADPDSISNGDVTVPTHCPSGGGGLVSSTADYLRFASMLLKGGELDGRRIISPMTIKRMTANSVPTDCLPLKIGIERYGYGFGLGFRVMMDIGRANGYSSVGEYGWSGAANTHLVIDPQQDLIILMMTQYWPAEPYPPRSIFPNLVYQAIDDLGG